MEFQSNHPALIALRDHWQDAHAGQVVLSAVTSPHGVTAHRIVRQFQNEFATECLTWAVTLEPHDTGSAIIPKFIAGLHQAIYRSTLMHSHLLNRIRQTIQKSKDQEEIEQLTIFRDALLLLKLSEGKTMVFPDDAPISALLKCIQFVVESYPTLMLIDKADTCHSMVIPTLLQLLAKQSSDEQKLLIIMTYTSVSDASQYYQPAGLLSLVTDLKLPVYTIDVLNKDVMVTLLESRNSTLTYDVANWWTGGSQALMADLLDWDGPYTKQDLREKSLPALPEESELILSVSALLGWRFPITPLARLCGCSEEEATALLNTNPIWVEVNNALPDGPPAYAFTRILPWYHLRRYVLQTQPNFGLAVAQNLEVFFAHNPVLLAAASYIRAQLSSPSSAEGPRNMLWGFEEDALWYELISLASEQELLWPEEAWDIGYLSAFRHTLDAIPNKIQETFSSARSCFQNLERPHAEIQLFCDAALFSVSTGDINLMTEHFNAALSIAQDINDTNSNIRIRLLWVEALLSVDEIRLAMVQLTLLESLEQTEKQILHRIWLTAQLAEKQNEKTMAIELYNKARQMSVEHRERHISASSGLAMIPLLIINEQVEEAKKLHQILHTEVEGDPNLESKWDEAKSYFI